MLRFLFLAASLLLLPFVIQAQDKHWIFFKDKNLTEDVNTSQEMIRDHPVYRPYLDSLETFGVKVLRTTKWLNAASVVLTEEAEQKITALGFVDSIGGVRTYQTTASTKKNDDATYSDLIKHLGVKLLKDKGIDGKDVLVGVIDAGFVRADSADMFRRIFKEERVLGFRDFIDPDREDKYSKMTKGDYHGRNVWGYIAGFDEEKKKQTGLATGASFYLARTENGDKEHRIEEDDWISAMEWMDSLGVRLINTSLGYSTFDDPEEDYEISDMNGRTTMISRAAEIAVKERGLFLVVSAGNMGHKDWKVVTAPADVRGALTVGATELKNYAKINYSSIGVDFVNYLKPNIATYSDRGTSYAAPAITGLVACMMQLYPEVPMKELREAIEKSGHLYPYGNNYIGYGVPDAARIIGILDDEYDPLENKSEIKVSGDEKITVDLGDDLDNSIVLFYKKNEMIVEEQDVVGLRSKSKHHKAYKKKGQSFIRLTRREGVERTTISAGDRVIEVFWN